MLRIPSTTLRGLRSVGVLVLMRKIFWAFQIILARLHGSTTCRTKEGLQHIRHCWIWNGQNQRCGGLAPNLKAHLTVPSGENGSQDFPVLLHLIKLFLQGALHVGICHHVLHDVFLQRPPQCSLVGAVELKPDETGQIQNSWDAEDLTAVLKSSSWEHKSDLLLFKRPVWGLECCQILEFHVFSGQAIFTITQLDNLVDGVTHRAIVLHHYRLHRFDQTTLDVTFLKEGAAVKDQRKLLAVIINMKISLTSTHKLTSLSSLYSSIDQTLSSSHGVEKELCRRQAGQIRVLHKASALRTIVIFDEMWQCAMFEAEGDSFTLHVLLPHDSNNLNKCKVNVKLASLLLFNCKCVYSLTCEMLIFDPLDPATTMDLKLLYSESDFWADDPVLSRASLRIRFTWFSKVCLSVLPGVGSSSLLWAFSMTCVQ